MFAICNTRQRCWRQFRKIPPHGAMTSVTWPIVCGQTLRVRVAPQLSWAGTGRDPSMVLHPFGRRPRWTSLSLRPINFHCRLRSFQNTFGQVVTSTSFAHNLHSTWNFLAGLFPIFPPQFWKNGMLNLLASQAMLKKDCLEHSNRDSWDRCLVWRYSNSVRIPVLLTN